MKLKQHDRSYLIGLILIVLGGLVLLSNLGILGGFGNLVGVALFASGGAIFVGVYGGSRQRLWALPVGFTLFGLAAALTDGALSGSYFLGLMGVGFGLVYYLHRRHWWALIPAGVLLTLALVAGIEAVAPGVDPGPVLFLGLAATFGALYLLPEGSQRWAIYPALATVVIAILAFSVGGGWLLPLVLIGLGVLLFSRQSSQPLETEVAPPPAPPAPAEKVTPTAAPPAPPEPAAADEPFVADTRLADQIAGAAGEQVEAELDKN